MESEQAQLRHYHLVTGEVFFRHKDSPEVATTRLNGILLDEDQRIPVRLIGKAQQIIQLNFFNMMGDDAKDCNVINCVIYSFSYLGAFTAAEFHTEPEAVDVQQAASQSGGEPVPATPAKLSVVPKLLSLEEAVEEAQKKWTH